MNVIDLSRFRLVFVLGGGCEVFLATNGMGRRHYGVAHRRVFDEPADAAVYARALADRVGCRVIGLPDDSQDKQHG
jgi:hypothetical protein